MPLGRSHSTWAHRVPGLWMEPRVSGPAHLSLLPGELAPSGGQYEEARVHFHWEDLGNRPRVGALPSHLEGILSLFLLGAL